MHQTFSALGDATRFTIVERLLDEGALSAGDIVDGFDMSAPAISRHLKVLREAGLIEQTIEAQKRIYKVRPQAVEDIHAWTITYREFWQGSLARLEQALDKWEIE